MSNNQRIRLKCRRPTEETMINIKHLASSMWHVLLGRALAGHFGVFRMTLLRSNISNFTVANF